MELISATVLILISFLTILYGYFKYSFEYWRSRNVPCDEPSIPYGNMKGIGDTLHSAQFTKNIYDKYKPLGHKLCGVYSFARPSVVLLDLELIKNVLIKDFEYFSDRGIYYNEKDDPLSAHLFTLDSDAWKKLRSKLTPTFTSGKMKFMFPTMVEVGERFRECLFDVVQQHDELEIRELLARFTTDVIGTCAFGIECNSLKDPNTEFRRYGRALTRKPRHSALFGIFINEFRNVAKKFRVKRFPDEVIDFFMKVVHDTVEYREKNNVHRNDFMDILIRLKNQETTDESKTITMNEVAAQAFIFFVAGFETSSTTLVYCLYELALNRDIQEKARKVVRDAYAKHDGNFTYEMMMDMHYIEQLLKETLRKYPPVGNLDRKTKSGYHVPGTKIIIEKGVSVLIPVYAIQHDSTNYPNPEKFDPDRFESEEAKKRDAMTWLPFGDGPRNCIGLRFGMMQTRIGLAILLKDFEFSLGSKTPVPLDFDPKSLLVMLPRSNVYLKFKSIKT